MAKVDFLNILRSKNKSPLEFKFDSLTAPPLLGFITMQDIERLHNIATSNRYAGKMEKKYKEIENVMRPRGFVKFASGTNRVVYRPVEDTSFVTKIALDEVGIKDNPAEYMNQALLRPFVTKVFEVAPGGSIASFERVLPITSREEFLTIGEDVFDLLNALVGKYILEDIGSDYFMNYGTRESVGPVLLDFPYLYELDGNKLHCNKLVPENNFMPCGGTIDYDVGFNNLVCTKCNKRYVATELRKENSDIKFVRKGVDLNMKVQIKKGDEVVKESENVTETIQPQYGGYDSKTPRVRKSHTLVNHADTSIGTIIVASAPKRKKGQYNNNNRPNNRNGRSGYTFLSHGNQNNYNHQDEFDMDDEEVVDIELNEVEAAVVAEEIKRNVREMYHEETVLEIMQERVVVTPKEEEEPEEVEELHTEEVTQSINYANPHVSQQEDEEDIIIAESEDNYIAADNETKEDDEVEEEVITDEGDDGKFLKDFNLSERDFEEPDDVVIIEELADKYGHLSEEFGEDNFEKIPKNIKQYY